MEVVILGSGTAVPHPRRGSAGVIVRRGDFSLLIDSGLGTLQKLAVLGISLADLSAVAYTHFHLDHTAELPSMLFALKNVGIGRRKPLVLYGAPGMDDYHRRLVKAYGPWIEPEEFPLAVEEIEDRPVSLGPLVLSAFPVVHTPQSVAFRIEDPEAGTKIALSGDTDVCEGLVAAARGADLAVFECSFPDGQKVEGHLTPGEAGRLASRAGVRRLVLSHFYPECEGEDILGQIRKTFVGEVALAEDLMRFVV